MDGISAAVGAVRIDESRRRRRGPGGIALALLAAGVLGTVVYAWRPGPPPLQHTFETPEQLAQGVLERLAARDRAGLAALALSEEEFRTRVWRELPASRPERNVPVGFAWSGLYQRNRAHLAQTFAEHAGRRYELVSVRFRGETTRHASFTVSRKAELTVRDERGDEHRLRLFGSVLSDGARYKLFSYAID